MITKTEGEFKKVEIVAHWGLNEQDPYEPIGVIFSQHLVYVSESDGYVYPMTLANVLKRDFGILAGHKGETTKRLKVTIEEIP